jgi:nucleoid-associated protein YgaU
MLLQQKYNELISAAQNAGISNLQVREQDNVLYIDGTSPSEQVKKQLWDIYNKIDPDYRAGDLIMNLTVSPSAAEEEYEVVQGDSLSKIGKKYNMEWKEIYEANREKIKDPDLIHPGLKLKIPRKA